MSQELVLSLIRTSKQTVERNASFTAKKLFMGANHALGILQIGTELLTVEVTAFSWTARREKENFYSDQAADKGSGAQRHGPMLV